MVQAVVEHVQDGIGARLQSYMPIENNLPPKIAALMLELEYRTGASPAPKAQRRPLEQISSRELADEDPAQKATSAGRQLTAYVDRLSQHLPAWLSKLINWLREPKRLLARAIVSILLIAGGVFAFLPIFGLWMLPLGLIIISQDLPFLQRPL
jgi:hypothetical protein